jgi:protease I
MHSNKLKGRRVAVLATHGFEKVELTVPVAGLKAAGADVDIVSLDHGRIRGVHLHEPASRKSVDKTLDEARAADYDALLIPGGLLNPDLLRQSRKARSFVQEFDRADKPIASICHGPWVLASAELLEGRTLTSWPGVRDDMVNAGATWLDEAVVTDGNLITSRGPQDLASFVPAVIEHFARADHGYSRAETSRTSAPQYNAPPQAVLTAMKWMPRPSFRTLAFAAIAAGIAWAASGSRRSEWAPALRRNDWMPRARRDWQLSSKRGRLAFG